MNRVDGTLLVLLWVARCDGPISRHEFAHILATCLRNSKGTEAIERLVACLRRMSSMDAEELQRAMVAMAKDADVDARKRLLQAVIALAMVDVRAGVHRDRGNAMPPAAVHVVRFLADALSGGLDGVNWLNEACLKVGTRVPIAGDPSDPEWWGSLASPIDPASDRLRVLTAREVQRIRDLAQLGLEQDAGDDLITMAYRFRARLFHPDKVRSESAQMQRLAEQEFQRIEGAYRRLKSR